MMPEGIRVGVKAHGTSPTLILSDCQPLPRAVSTNMSERIVIDPNICNGRPVVKGTRITVQTIVEFLAAGDSVDDVLEEYPTLTREDVRACLGWVSRLMANHFQLAPLS